jgi:hypothetical protein
MEVLMRRSLMTMLAGALGFTVACGSDVLVGTRSDGVTVYCNEGEYYYECTPDHPDIGPGGGAQGGGTDPVCGPDTFACPDGSGGGSPDGDGEGDGDGSGSGTDGGGTDGGGDDGGGGGSGTQCGPDT